VGDGTSVSGSRPIYAQLATGTRQHAAPCSPARRACRVVPFRAADRHASRLLVASGAVSQLAAPASAATAAAEGVQHLADRLLGMYVLADVNASAAAAGTAEAPTRAGGWFEPLADALESVLKVLQTGLDQVHVPYSYGYSIILLTLFVKVITYPLAKQQVTAAPAAACRWPWRNSAAACVHGPIMPAAGACTHVL
jgi:hypothetical protein